jgi:surface polysaccharide O-acyltransferase-like enzyme
MNIEHEKVDILWVHVIKAFSIVMVIIIHASADLFYEFGNIPEKAWIASVIYQSFARIGVPLFFMISGFLLLGKQENLGFFFRKRIMKLVLPLIFWSAFYVFWRIVFFKEPVGFWQTLIQTLQNESFPHLWFLYTMLAVYLTYPLLRLLVQYGTQTVQWYFVILWLVVLILFPSLEYYLGIRISDNLLGSMGAFSGYLGYPVLGYLLGKMPRHNRLVAAMIPVVLISPFATLLRTYIGTISSGQVNETYFHYLSPNVIFPAAASFYLVRVIVSSLENSWGNRLKY